MKRGRRQNVHRWVHEVPYLLDGARVLVFIRLGPQSTGVTTLWSKPRAPARRGPGRDRLGRRINSTPKHKAAGARNLAGHRHPGQDAKHMRKMVLKRWHGEARSKSLKASWTPERRRRQAEFASRRFGGLLEPSAHDGRGAFGGLA